MGVVLGVQAEQEDFVAFFREGREAGADEAELRGFRSDDEGASLPKGQDEAFWGWRVVGRAMFCWRGGGRRG